MPGTPMDPENSKLNKLQKDNVQQKNAENEQNLQNEPVVRELTQTDILNKRLLVSFLDRINNKFEDHGDLEEKQTENKEKDQVDSDF